MRRLLLVLTLLATFGGVARADDPDPPMYACHAAPPTMKIRVAFAPKTSLKDMIAWVIGFTCKNVVAASDLVEHAPSMVIVAPAEMTPKQALQLFVDAVESTGLVVTIKGDNIQIKLGPNMPMPCGGGGTSPTTTTTTTTTAPAPTPADVDGIVKVDDTHYKIPRALAVKLAASAASLVADMRVVPSMHDGKPDGYKLYAIRPSSLAARVGFTNGDTVREVNGFALTDDQKALAAFAKLKDATHFEFAITRRGKPETIAITVQ